MERYGSWLLATIVSLIAAAAYATQIETSAAGVQRTAGLPSGCDPTENPNRRPRPATGLPG
jgi:hypothetical protein